MSKLSELSVETLRMLLTRIELSDFVVAPHDGKYEADKDLFESLPRMFSGEVLEAIVDLIKEEVSTAYVKKKTHS